MGFFDGERASDLSLATENCLLESGCGGDEPVEHDAELVLRRLQAYQGARSLCQRSCTLGIEGEIHLPAAPALLRQIGLRIGDVGAA